jgi:predicted MFS family arabinose efflux permease
MRLVFRGEPRAARPKYPVGSFVRRFLLALVGWNLAVGAFNPFFNAFFARHLSAGMEQIGIVFSAGQLAQVVAMMAAPIVLRRLGLVNGVMSTQIAAGLSLALLAHSNSLPAAAAAYAGYAAFQYMSEPGVYTLLMGRVRPEEQSGASSLNFLVAFGAQAISAMLAGAALSRYGYLNVIPVIAAIAILSAFLFRALLRQFEARHAGNAQG